jgi:hypothetical protein
LRAFSTENPALAVHSTPFWVENIYVNLFYKI